MSNTRFDLSDPDARAFCPSCGSGFRSSTVRCVRCDAELLSRSEAEARSRSQTGDDGQASTVGADVVWLGDLTSLPAANFLQTSLEAAAIPFLRKSSGPLAGPFGNWMNQQTTFMVDPEHLDRAREIFRRAASEAEDFDTITASSVPPDTVTGDVEPRCPKCACGFLEVEVDGVPVRSCEACGGLWVFESELRRLHDAEASTPADLPSMESLRGKIGDLACPTCEERLETIQVSQTQLDRCPGCRGIYLDLGELEEVVGPISPTSGGDLVLRQALGVIAAAFGMVGMLRGGD